MTHNLRFAARTLLRAPSFTITAVATLAIVIGANTAVFSLVDAILLRPLGYPEPERLALLQTTVRSPRGESSTLSQDGAAWESLKGAARALRAAPVAGGGGSANLVVAGTPLYVRQQRVGAGFFSVLGVPPQLGREFTAEEDRPGGAAVAILSHALWQRSFQGDDAVVGRPILLRGEPHEVVGIMPRGFRSTTHADLWTPLRPATSGEGGGSNYAIVARVPAGVSPAQVEAELAATAASLLDKAPRGRDATLRLSLAPLQDALVGDTRRPIVMLAAAAGSVLLIACVNLAGLLLARGVSRSGEIATRLALGAPSGAVLRQLLAESVLLAALGGGLGLLLGALGLAGLQALGAQTFSEWSRAAVDLRVVAVTAAVSLATSLLFGLLPALHTLRLDLRTALVEGGSRGAAGGARHGLRRGLVTAEVALGVALLVSTGLLLRTFLKLQGLEPGFDPRHVVIARASLQDARYATAAQVNRLFDQTLTLLQAAPGIEAAAVSLELPYERLLNLGVRFPDRPADAQSSIANVSYVSPDFFATLRIPIRRGRGFGEQDAEGAPAVVVVNEGFVRFYLKDTEPLGRRIVLSGKVREIVGIVGDVQQRGAGFFLTGMTRGPLTIPPLVYLPARQTSDAFLRLVHTWFQPVWSVRAKGDAAGAAALRDAIARADPLLPVIDVSGMARHQASATAQQRLLVVLVGVLGAAATLLAALGIHGLIAQAVAERTRELGIRMALGATAARMVREAALPGVVLASIGALIGGALSIAGVDLVRSFLWGVAPHDPATYAGVALVLFLVATVSSLVPALRIARLDPARTLRR
jgi:predicted permease